MHELAPGVFFIPGKNRSRFPYCGCLYVKGKDARILIDAGMGGSRLAPVKQQGIDLLLFTHSHIDHRLTRRQITEVPVGCHPDEKPYLCDVKRFLEGTGFARSGLDVVAFYENDPSIFDMRISRLLSDGERIDLGGVSLEVILTPGHTPGHLAFFIPEHGLLFAGDVDLTPFGPFYGHDFSDISDFIASIGRLKRIGAKTVATGHGGPFSGNIQQRFEAFEKIIYRRDRAVLDRLDRPRTAEELAGCGIIYRGSRDQDRDGGLNRWFEQVHIEKQLRRLAGMEAVARDPETGRWYRTG